MQQLLPVLLGWLSESPDPDQGLLDLRTLAGGPHRRDLLVTAFAGISRAGPPALPAPRHGPAGSATSSPATRTSPTRLDDERALARLRRDELVERAMIAASQGPDRRAGALRHFFEIETLRIAARDVFGISPVFARPAAL